MTRRTFCVVLVAVVVLVLLLISGQVTCIEPPSLLRKFSCNFVLTSPLENRTSSSNDFEDYSALLVQPGGNRVGVLYFDFDKGFVVHLFAPNTGDSTSTLYDHKHMIPQNVEHPIQVSILGLRNMTRGSEVSTLYHVANKQCSVWGSIDNSFLPTQFKIPNTTNSQTRFNGFSIQNGIHAEQWQFKMDIVMYAHRDQTEYETFEMTVFVSRFDQTLVQVTIEPTPFGVRQLSMITFNMVPNDPHDAKVFQLPPLCY